MSSAICFNLNQSKILLAGKGLNHDSLMNLKDTKKFGQTFCFANWVQNKGSLSMFCIALGVFIRTKLVNGKKINTSTQSQVLMILKKKDSENIVGKKRKCFSSAFSPVPTTFSSMKKKKGC